MTVSQNAMVAVMLKAFRGLSKGQRQLFLEELLRERAYREDLLDAATIQARRNEPARPLKDYLAERSKRTQA
jgi:hypothetical protein